MQLLIDAGNTKIKWATVTAMASVLGRWTASGSVFRDNIDHLEEAWQAHAISKAFLCNVAGPTSEKHLRSILDNMLPSAAISRFSSQRSLAGVQNDGYSVPEQLGSDRFAAMIGARALFPNQALIVANCGTATTIDALTTDGRFIGGMIAPGVGLMANSLAKNTAQLPQVSPKSVTRFFAGNTEDAIWSGCVSSQVGAIEHAFALHTKNSTDVLCILAGGAAPLITPHLHIPHRLIDQLVLTGLHAVVLQQP